MEKFIAIGTKDGWQDSFDFVMGVLAYEQPGLIMVDYSLWDIPILSGLQPHPVCKCIERGESRVTLELSSPENPRIYLDSLCVFSDILSSPPIAETKAGVAYALSNDVPVFFSNEPFLNCTSFSKNLRTKGIIGFFNKYKPAYTIVYIDHERHPPKKFGMGVKQRNLFLRDAVNTLDEYFQPKVIASIGPMTHYYLTEKVKNNPLLEAGYTQKDTLTEMVEAENIIVFDTRDMRRII